MKAVSYQEWPLLRLIVPHCEINIFSWLLRKTTSLGAVMVATSANKVWGWRVELIDENNYRGARDHRRLPDHQKLQEESPATIVGFYCGLSSTIERVWELAEFYKSQGVFTIAGGWHAHYCPEETLNHYVDIVVHGDGEVAIRQILCALKEQKSFKDIVGISFWDNGKITTNKPETKSGMLEIDLNDLPLPDFNLLKYSGKIKIYPISRTKGCGMNCEYCSVKGTPRFASARHLFNTVEWLVKTRRAKNFFIVDDRLEQDLEGTMEFFRLIAEKYGRQLNFTVQVRLDAADNIEFLEIMKKAGVRTYCIGYESPIDEELKAMRKALLSSKMLSRTKTFHKYGKIHAMFIVGYAATGDGSVDLKKEEKVFKQFIRAIHPDVLQILLPVPLVGTKLRERLKAANRILPPELVPWSKYDGLYVCFNKPVDSEMDLLELQGIPKKIMRRFYDPIGAPLIIAKILTFPLDYLARGWERWHGSWSKDIIKVGGYILIQRWEKGQRQKDFIRQLKEFQLKSQKK